MNTIVIISNTGLFSGALGVLFLRYEKNIVITSPVLSNRNSSNGTLNNVGTNGNYWTSTPNTINTDNGNKLNFNDNNVSPANNNNRAYGNAVSRVSETK